MTISDSIASFTGVKDALKIIIGLLLGLLLAFPVGCYVGNNKSTHTSYTDTVYKHGEKTFIYDTVKKVIAKETLKTDSFYIYVETPNGFVRAVTDKPVTLSEFTLGTTKTTDTLTFFRDTCKEKSSVASLFNVKTAAEVEYSPFVERAFSVGITSSVTLDKFFFAVNPKLIYNLSFDSLYQKHSRLGAYVNLKIGYVL